MTRQKLWNIYAAKNPSFNGDGEVTLKASGLKKLFEQTWDAAFQAGQDKNKTTDRGAELFNQLFGKFK
jgi:hypothetical protein